MIVLEITSGGVTRTLRVARDVVTLGRAEGSCVALDDVALSRTHCQFERVGNSVWVRDLNSRNGTRVRGELVTRARLEPGEEVLLGNSRVLFIGLESDAESPGLGMKTLQLILGRNRKRGETKDLKAENERLRQLLLLVRPLVEELDQDRVLLRIVDTAIDLTGAERGFVLVARDDGFSVEVARDFWRRDILDAGVEISHRLAMTALREKRGLIVEDASEDERFREFLSVHALQLRSVLCVPLLFRGTALGALYLDNRFTRGTFREEDYEDLRSFADLAAIALENSGRFASERRQREQLALEVELHREELLRARASERDGRRPEPQRPTGAGFIAHSAVMRDLLDQVERVRTTDIPVVLEGPSGTGKEDLARFLHEQGPRASGPFFVLACAALPASLAEVELFGHAAGAYTGAGAASPGILENVFGGTLYLEGVDDLALETQALFLRVLESGEYRRVGATESRRANLRIVAGSRHSLASLIAEGRFRADLYYRLKGVLFRVPTLAERPEDLPEILERLQRDLAPKIKLTPAARKALLRRPWPGNLVELRNEFRRLATLGSADVDVADLSPQDLVGPIDLKSAVADLERRLVHLALDRHEGNITRAASELGLSRLGLRNKIARLGIPRTAVSDPEDLAPDEPPEEPGPAGN